MFLAGKAVSSISAPAGAFSSAVGELVRFSMQERNTVLSVVAVHLSSSLNLRWVRYASAGLFALDIAAKYAFGTNLLPF